MQDENEEMGRELSEGRLTQLERSLVAAREQLEELRRVYSGKQASALGYGVCGLSGAAVYRCL